MSTVTNNTTFANKVAFVTGGARGIGAAIVRRLAADGAAVAFTYQSSSDAADADAVVAAIGKTAAEFGKIDILVNNAGVLRMGDVGEFTLKDFDDTVAVNIRAVFVAVQAVLPFMDKGGRIINNGSTNAIRMPVAGGAAYAMSKSALVGLVQGLSRDLAPRGITINNVQPGPVDTDMNPESGDFGGALHALMAIQRHGRPEEIAGMVAYVASPEAAFVTGAHLSIDGGFAA
jgi:3-oxoacyl-[acyl-carrier protein] reductase